MGAIDTSVDPGKNRYPERSGGMTRQAFDDHYLYGWLTPSIPIMGVGGPAGRKTIYLICIILFGTGSLVGGPVPVYRAFWILFNGGNIAGHRRRRYIHRLS